MLWLKLSNLFIYTLIILCQWSIIGCSPDDEILEELPEPSIDILDQLRSLEGLNVIELDATDHFERLFELRYPQPVDHNNPSGQTFLQKMYLGHVSTEETVVFETEGYARSNHRTRELAPVLGANQLAVEHRYYGVSVPNSREWQFLTVWQAANDLHRIVELLKPIYGASWVSSGRSKGGDTAIFHRRFFPNDVEATLAYVAPILFEARDSRYLDYYNEQGTEECRERLRQFQRAILSKLDEIPDVFQQYVDEVDGSGPVFTFSLDHKSIVYHATREDYWFEFWSSESENCSTIPDSSASIEDLFAHFRGVFDIRLFFSDWGVEFWTPYVYQAETELGNYAFDESHLIDLIRNDIPNLTDFGVTTSFDPEVMRDIASWVSLSASEIVFVYGEKDPWTVAAFQPGSTDRILEIYNPGTKHDTQLSSLSAIDRNLVLSKLQEWMGE